MAECRGNASLDLGYACRGGVRPAAAERQIGYYLRCRRTRCKRCAVFRATKLPVIPTGIFLQPARARCYADGHLPQFWINCQGSWPRTVRHYLQRLAPESVRHRAHVPRPRRTFSYGLRPDARPEAGRELASYRGVSGKWTEVVRHCPTTHLSSTTLAPQ